MKLKSINNFIFLLCLFCALEVFAQDKSYSIEWRDPITYGLESSTKYQTLNFEGAHYDFSNSKIPFMYLDFQDGQILSEVQINVQAEEDLTSAELEALTTESNLPELEPKVTIENTTIRKRNKAFVRVYPIYKNSNGKVKKVTEFSLKLSKRNSFSKLKRNKSMSFSSSSLLSRGEWFKVGVLKSGVYRLNYSFLKSLGVDVDDIDPRNLKLYGYGGGALPEANSVVRPDDMLENPILAVGQEDGVFNKSDYFVFFGEDQVQWRYDSLRSRFTHDLNPYSDTTFYFISISNGLGKRVSMVDNTTLTPTNQISEFDDYGYYERDLVNLIQSGREWLGEAFDNQLSYTLPLNVPDVVNTEEGSLEFFGVARAGVTSSFSVNIGNNSMSVPVGATILDRYEVSYGKVGRGYMAFQPQSNALNINVTYNKPQASAKAWLNYVNVNLRRKLNLRKDFMLFRDSRSVGVGEVTQFNLQSIRKPTVWDVTDVSSIQELKVQTIGGNFSFIDQTSSLKEYVAFTEADSMNLIALGNVPNQNLHNLPQADMVIVSHPRFINQANELAGFHQSEGLRVNVVTTNQVYNEFSSGSQDVIAIRSFMKMFYDRASDQSELPRYLLLIGDASYDYKNRLSGNTNFVLGYQSRNFLEPVYSYVSDDFLALLDDNEGTWPVTTVNPEKLDIAVGRLPVKTVREAQGVVDKIKRYNTSSTLSEWRNKITFVGDDEDGVTHMSQANQLSQTVSRQDGGFDIDKILLDAYKQVSTSGGSRYPDVNKAINNAVQEGSLILNYTGHGGETGWAGERILTISDITNWKGLDNMPIFLTATCEFSRFDDPFRTSAGELVLLNSEGGGVALMTTTRLVYSSPNYVLNNSFYSRVFERNSNGETPRLGDVFMQTKNLNAASSNSRNFSLLGDPALKIALPQHQVITSSINGTPLSQLDTLKALSKVTISGFVADVDGNKLSGFNGLVYPSVFDKKRTVKTLNNDGSGVFEYGVYDSKIFKGKATVTNGDFNFTFIVPKDIDYKFGRGRLSYYAQNGNTDANGHSTSLIVGGSADSAIADSHGPEIELFMNDESFVYGGVTNPKPTLIAKLYDQLGVNTVGSGIGHDLMVIIDGNTENAINLNDYYEAEQDNYQEGTIRYPLEELSEGKHTIKLKAWDVANNSSEKTIEFNVVSDKEVEIDNLVNYPNPFTTNTEFIFQHNQPGIPLDVKIEVFTVSGKLVKSIDRVVVNEGFLSRDIRWDGKDDFGDAIGKGVYVYKLTVRARNGSRAEEIQKLVIL